jgi:predicted anti-sigma-YlaC factor YlaD
MDVDCSHYREALSARMDGEELPIPAADLDEHLAGCAACRDWQHGAAELTRRLRVRPAAATPDLAAAVTAAADHIPRRKRPRWSWPRSSWPRLLLAVVAVCQLGLGLAQMTAVGPGLAHGHHGGEPLGGHLFNESTAWNFALGIGLLASAVTVRAVAGLIPVLAVFLLALTGFSVLDLVHGEVPVSRLLSHGFLVLGLVLLLLVRRDDRRRRPDRGSAGGDETFANADDPDLPDDRGDEPGRRRLRPVGFRRAA